MTREIRELEAIVADMKAASARFNARLIALRDREIQERRAGIMRFNSKGEAYYE